MLNQLSRHFKLTALLALILLPYSQLHAHAVVTDTSLNVEKIAPNKATKVRLTFNSQVELGLSQIFLVSAGDKMQLLNAEPGGHQGNVIIDIPPLTPGEYALKLSIFAADGHLSEDIVRFFVAEGK
ncbi:copper resistance CopC family protein [Methylomarinum sp. Ch1-1]|uniref:Copper resistance CopC family protein n=1 Tax=Methylomarinum roseum TaxID=3067653 RepID=A0AAU7NSF8_9GAMM|nr:copper resistance CopC family protein [Methylomarinum sp. Ch1-1]MDP4520119.1 copper resistance protein CopC [Methylomarinum sp. Ch1-1]